MRDLEPILCLFRVLIVDMFKRSDTAFFSVTNLGTYSYFYYISGSHGENREIHIKWKLKRGEFRSAQRVKKGVQG